MPPAAGSTPHVPVGQNSPSCRSSSSTASGLDTGEHTQASTEKGSAFDVERTATRHCPGLGQWISTPPLGPSHMLNGRLMLLPVSKRAMYASRATASSSLKCGRSSSGRSPTRSSAAMTSSSLGSGGSCRAASANSFSAWSSSGADGSTSVTPWPLTWPSPKVTTQLPLGEVSATCAPESSVLGPGRGPRKSIVLPPLSCRLRAGATWGTLTMPSASHSPPQRPSRTTAVEPSAVAETTRFTALPGPRNASINHAASA